MSAFLRFLPAVLVLAALVLPMRTVGAQAAASPCDVPEAHQLDFWLGEWRLTWPGGQGGTPEGGEGRGTNTVRRVLDGCVVQEDFASAEGFRGRSVSVYDRRAGQWRQTWVDSSGGYLVFTGGLEDGEMRLYTEPFTNQNGQPQVNRMLWRNVTNEALDWHWQRSTDGGETWEDLWIIHYTRAP